MQLITFKYHFLTLLFAFFYLTSYEQEIQLSSQQKASLKYLDSFVNIAQSHYWHNVTPSLFINNIRKNLIYPSLIYSGTNTNFCAYAALSFTCIKNYPLRYTKFMIELYNNGQASFRNVKFNPSYKVKVAAGLLEFKGVLDINHADQLWYMSLADHFKG